MIQTQTVLKLADNSGVKLASCIQVYNKKIGGISSFILVSIKNLRFNGKIKKGDLLKAIIIRVKAKLSRETGHFLAFNENALVLLNKKNELHATRIFGPVCYELRKKNFVKLLALASIIL